MNRSTEQIQLIVVGGVYFFVLMLLICSLQLLIKMARIQMKPRQKYVKPDPLFKSYDAQQNWNWDWVMVFRVYGPDSYVSDYQRHYSLRLIVERLEMGGLQTKLYKSYHYDKIFCKIRCTSDRLKDQAAAVDYPLLMDETEVKMRIERGYRDEFGKYKWYPRRDGWKLASEGDEGEKLEKTFNNAIVDTEGQSGYAFNEHIYGKYDKRGDLQSPSVYVTYPASNSIFRSVDRLKLMMGIMEGDIKQEGCSLILKELITRGACLAIYPLHDDDALQTIQDRWLTYLEPPWAQPIDLVKDYFGEKVGMYFLFLGTYSTWLFYAGALGIVTYALEIVPSPFAVWSTTFCGIFSYANDVGERGNNSWVFDEHFRNIQGHVTTMPFMTVPGNHEAQYDYAPYINRLPMPRMARASKQLAPFYYAFDYGPAHFIAYSSEEGHSLKKDSEQWRFIAADLEAANKNRAARPWIVAFTHHPMYCSDLITESTRCRKEAFAYRRDLEDLFHEHKLDLHISGHNHQYERSVGVYGCDEKGTKKCELSAETHNHTLPIYIVNGAGGDTEGIDPTWVPEFLAPFRAFHASGLRTGLATVDLNLTHLVWRFQYTGRGAWPHSRPFEAATTVDELVLSRDLIRD